MIKNVIFDLADVIMGSYFGIDKILEKNYSIPSKEFLNRDKQTMEVFLDTMRGKYTEEEYLNYLLNGTNWNITIDQLKNEIRQKLKYTDENTMKILKELKNNYNLILLSDHVREWIIDLFRYNPDLTLFDYTYFSYSLGRLKRDEGTFKYVLEDLKIKPDETIFIDDSKKNIESAKKYGIECIQFINAEKLEKELKNRNVLRGGKKNGRTN